MPFLWVNHAQMIAVAQNVICVERQNVDFLVVGIVADITRSERQVYVVHHMTIDERQLNELIGTSERYPYAPFVFRWQYITDFAFW